MVIPMKLFLISQNENSGYDTYDSAVVCAESEEDAKKICPGGGYVYNEELKIFHWWYNIGTDKEQYEPSDLCMTWATQIENVDVEYLGEAKEGSERGEVCSSFNAG